MERAVQTMPPMISPLTMPCQPSRPTATRITDERISVISVMPETGLVPTMAMALGGDGGEEEGDDGDGEQCHYGLHQGDLHTDEQEDEDGNKSKEEKEHHKRHCQVALRPFTAGLFRIGHPFLLTASLKALPMTPDDLMMPMMPAMAMAPMPMGRT